MPSHGNGLCSSVLLKPLRRTQASSKKEEKKPAEKDSKDTSKKQESKSTKSDAPSSSSASDPKKDEKKHGRKFTCSLHVVYFFLFLPPSAFWKVWFAFMVQWVRSFLLPPIGKSPGKMLMLNQSKGQQGFNKPRLPFRRGGRFDKVLMMYCAIFIRTILIEDFFVNLAFILLSLSITNIMALILLFSLPLLIWWIDVLGGSFLLKRFVCSQIYMHICSA